MARQLYRVYLYVVSIALLILAAVGLAILLNTLLASTPLRGSYRVAPEQRETVQSVVFAITAWIIAAALGALHLRLIRRDLAEFPDAARGGVRAFFLNFTASVGTLVVVIAGAGAFSTLANAYQGLVGDSAGPFALAIAAALVVVALEVEQRRYPPTPGSATVFRRLHLFGIPLILLVITTLAFWNEAVRTTLTSVLISTNTYSPLDPNACDTGQFNPGPIDGPCSLPSTGFLWLATLVPIAVIALYAYTARDDRHSLIRMVAHIGSFALGIGALLFGLVRGIELLLRAVFGVAVTWRDVAHPWAAAYDFISPLTIGLLIVVAYGLWLRAERADLPVGAQITSLVTEAVAAVLFAAAFWWGVGRIAYTLFQWMGATSGESFAERWAGAIALALAGVVYIPIAVHLRGATKQTGQTAPRRGFILALLAGGIITGAVGLTMSLYAFGTSLLGAPLTDWQQTVRAGLASLAVGVILVVSYGWIALQERSLGSLFKRLREAPSIPPATAPAQAGAVREAAAADVAAEIEQILGDFEAHRISLPEASARLRALVEARGQGTSAQPAHA